MTVRELGTGLSTAGRRWRGLSANTRAILWMLLGTAMFATMTALIKALAAHYDSFQISFFRSFFAFLVFLPVGLIQGLPALRTSCPMLHIRRGLVGTSSMLTGYYSVAHLPLALSTSISFAAPLFLVVLAVLALGEIVGWRRWLATAIGFLGVVVMMRPGQGIDPAALVGLAAAALSATSVVLTKKMPVSERQITILIWATLVSSVACLPFALWRWSTPDLADFWLLASVGLVGAAGQAIWLHSYRLGEVSVVGPIDYTRLIFATIIGFLWFGEWPDTWTMLGAAIIVASTAYIAHREARLRRNIPRGPGVA
ncbi:MAG: DMT family transporter [Alphaproteobacteria bacterium]|nr:DMT family transporter [Alphaproteobacteria bacterium]